MIQLNFEPRNCIILHKKHHATVAPGFYVKACMIEFPFLGCGLIVRPYQSSGVDVRILECMTNVRKACVNSFRPLPLNTHNPTAILGWCHLTPDYTTECFYNCTTVTMQAQRTCICMADYISSRTRSAHVYSMHDYRIIIISYNL